MTDLFRGQKIKDQDYKAA